MEPGRIEERDDLARLGAIAIACARIGIGVTASVLTRPALRAIGFEEPDGATVALTRLAGGRDIAVGVQTLSARDDRDSLRRSVLLAAAVDAGDAATFAIGLVRGDGIARAAAINFPFAAAAAVAGAYLAGRLSRTTWGRPALRRLPGCVADASAQRPELARPELVSCSAVGVGRS
jgi:hypothetical protein